MTDQQVQLFLADLAIIILLARLLGIAAKRLGQPPVLGEIIAGTLLGPTLFHGKITATLFPVTLEAAVERAGQPRRGRCSCSPSGTCWPASSPTETCTASPDAAASRWPAPRQIDVLAWSLLAVRGRDRRRRTRDVGDDLDQWVQDLSRSRLIGQR